MTSQGTLEMRGEKLMRFGLALVVLPLALYLAWYLFAAAFKSSPVLPDAVEVPTLNDLTDLSVWATNPPNTIAMVRAQDEGGACETSGRLSRSFSSKDLVVRSKAVDVVGFYQGVLAADWASGPNVGTDAYSGYTPRLHGTRSEGDRRYEVTLYQSTAEAARWRLDLAGGIDRSCS